MTAPVAAIAGERARRSLPVDARDVAVLGGTVVLWFVVMTLAARSVGWAPFATPTWGRWDSGQYLSIAKNGYIFENCVDVANRGPEDWCGNSGWFPAYPWMMRFGSWLGFGYDTFGRLVSFVAMVGAWTVLWFGFLRRRPAVVGALGMAIAAMFPASVYYGAIFPVSSMLVAMLLALWCLDRSRWLLAGVFGAVAATTYTSGFLVGSIALVPLLAPSVGDLRARLRATLAVGGPVALAYVAVMANFQREVGAWNAAFETQASYNLSPTLPLTTIRRQFATMGNDALPGAIGAQTALVLAMVVAATWVVVRYRDDLSFGEWGTAIMCGFLWLIPLTLGSDLSLYRAESLLLPIVIVLVRLRPPVLAVFAVVCVPVAYKMAQLFFDATLI